MFDLFIEFWWQFCLVALFSYWVGNVNFAVIFSRLIKKKDVRKLGSGNPGTTNMFRVFGLPMGLLTFVCDCLKGVICCGLARLIFLHLGSDVSNQAGYIAGVFVVLGHIFPVLYRFRGGKGVATSIGVIAVMQPVLMACCIAPILVIIFISDRMSVMSLLWSVFMIVWTWTVLYKNIDAFNCAVLTVMFTSVIFAHRHNIVRICCGKEQRIGLRKAFKGKKGEKPTEDNRSDNSDDTSKQDE